MTKKYVTVISRTDEQGFIEPRKIIMGTRHWPVKVLSSTSTDGRGWKTIQYTITIPLNGTQHETSLWYEIPDVPSVRPKWFVDTRE